MNDGTANSLITAAASSSDPLFTGLAFIIVVVMLLAIASKPLIGLINDYKQTNVLSARADAESKLYEQLRLQIEANSKDIAELKHERDEFKRKAEHLEDEVVPLVEKLERTLAEKERIIKERDDEIRKLTRQLLDLKERLLNLELRLDKDEAFIDNSQGVNQI
ncbi:hypothetical protein [Flavobacterium sp.]|uniref:hypothetical protein n=1 Tax=Flavobacterium sp. TaxID=239 RepID=UPI0037C0BDB1